jgi:hypothetical protein
MIGLFSAGVAVAGYRADRKANRQNPAFALVLGDGLASARPSKRCLGAYGGNRATRAPARRYPQADVDPGVALGVSAGRASGA